MSTTAKSVACLAAFAAGLLLFAFRHHGAAIDSHLAANHLHTMDWVMLVFGSACIVGLAWSFYTDPDDFDWRGAVWIVIGGVMIYAALGGNPWLKEQACEMLASRHNHYGHACYF